MIKTTNYVSTLVECSLMIAIGTVLMLFPLYTLPNGGEVTLVSMLPFILVSFRHGVRWGMMTGLARALLQLLIGFYAPPAGTLFAFFGMILLDYLLAFMLLGLASVFARPFPNRMLGIAVATVTVCFLRFFCSFLSGFLIWGSIVTDGMGAVLYSLSYNVSYMLPETLLTTGAALLLYKIVPNLYRSRQS